MSNCVPYKYQKMWSLVSAGLFREYQNVYRRRYRNCVPFFYYNQSQERKCARLKHDCVSSGYRKCVLSKYRKCVLSKYRKYLPYFCRTPWYRLRSPVRWWLPCHRKPYRSQEAERNREWIKCNTNQTNQRHISFSSFSSRCNKVQSNLIKSSLSSSNLIG